MILSQLFLIINNLFLYLLCKTGTKVISKQTVYQLTLKLSHTELLLKSHKAKYQRKKLWKTALKETKQPRLYKNLLDFVKKVKQLELSNNLKSTSD